MNPKYEIHEWIDRYLSNEMSESERREFEEALRGDEQLAKTLEAQKVAYKVVIGEELLQLKKQMAHDLRGNGYSSGGTDNKAWWYYISGTLVATLSVVFFFMQQKTNPTNDLTASEELEKKTLLVEDSIMVSETKEEVSLKDAKTPELKKQLLTTEKNKQVEGKTSLCSDSIINFSCQALGTCIQKEEGAIEIDVKTIKVGHAPYRFGLLPEGNFQETAVLSDLKAGKYQLYVKDAEQCLHKLNVQVEVPVINCPK